MDWFLLAIAGTACFAATAVIDKVVLNRYAKDPTAYLVFLILLQQIFTAAILLAKGVPFTYPYSALALLAGLFQILFWGFYLPALKVEEASRVTTLAFVYPLFVFVAAAILLGEVLSPLQYLGGILLVLAAVLVSYRPSGAGSILLSPALKYMLIFWVFISLYSVTAKYLLSFMDEWSLYFWTSIGNLISCVPLLFYKNIRTETFGLFRAGPRVLAAIMAEEAFDFFSRVSFIFAYAAGPVVLVASVNALQPFMVLVLAAGLGIFIPGLIKEDLDGKTLAFKLAAVALVAVGIYLIN